MIMKNATVAILLLCFQMALADWVLEVQLHNYTNPTNALYEVLNGRYCCCENCQREKNPFCSKELSNLNCTCPTGNTGNCDLQLQVCSQYSRFVEEQCYSTEYQPGLNELETSFAIEGSFIQSEFFEILRFTGSFHEPATQGFAIGEVNLIINTYENDNGNLATPADEFDILLPFNILYTFLPPESYQSKYETSWITFSYRFYCIEGYYGQYCSKYCIASNDSSTGYYMCDCEGNKLCLPGYTDPTNNCIQESISSTYSSTATSSDSTVVTVTVTSNVTCTPATTCTNSSTQIQTWQGTAFLFFALFALSVGIIIGICSVGIVKCITNKRKHHSNYQPATYENPSHYGQNGPIAGISLAGINNQLYSDDNDEPSLPCQYLQNRPPAETPVEMTALKCNYEEVANDDNETYDRVKHN